MHRKRVRQNGDFFFFPRGGMIFNVFSIFLIIFNVLYKKYIYTILIE